jgi:AAA+ superfamily predicted ATPase
MTGANGTATTAAIVPIAITQPEKAAGVRGYATISEHLAAYEEEIVLRVERCVAGLTSQRRRARRPSESSAKKIEALKARRLARTRATTIYLPIVYLSEQLGLSAEEESLVAYLLFLAEGVRLPLAVEQERLRDFDTARMALAIACGTPDASYTHRHLLAASAPLFRADLIDGTTDGSFTEMHLSLTAATTALLLDDDTMFSHLHPGLSVIRPTETLDDVVLTAEAREVIGRIVNHHAEYLEDRKRQWLDTRLRYGHATTLLFHGLPGTGKTLAARAMAGATKRPLVMIDPTAGDRWSDQAKALAAGMAEARRSGGLVFIDEVEQLIQQGKDRNLLAFLESAETIVILATNHERNLSSAVERRILHKLEFPLPDAAMRRAIWTRHLPGLADDVVSDLANRYWISGGYIKNAVLSALQVAAASGQSSEMPRPEQLGAAAADQVYRFEDSLAGLVGRIPIDPAMAPPAGFDPALLGEVRNLLRDIVASSAGRPTPRVVLTGRNRGALWDAVQYLGAAVDQPMLRIRRFGQLVENDEMRAKQRTLRALMQGNRRQFTVVMPIGEQPWIAANVAWELNDLIGDAASVVFIVTTETDVANAGWMGDVLIRIDHRLRAPQATDLRKTAADEGIDVGDVDWNRINAEARAMHRTAAGLCRIAQAEARRRGAGRVETADFLAAIGVARRAALPAVRFGRGD